MWLCGGYRCFNKSKQCHSRATKFANNSLQKLEDRTDSFFMSETCKYLYLLFDPDYSSSYKDVVSLLHNTYLIIVWRFQIFTTEGHIIPLSSNYHISPTTSLPIPSNRDSTPTCKNPEPPKRPIFEAFSNAPPHKPKNKTAGTTRQQKYH